MPVEQVLGHDAGRVPGPDHPVDLIAVEIRGVTAAASLDMVRETSRRRVCAVAERAVNVGPTMDARVQVLPHTDGGKQDIRQFKHIEFRARNILVKGRLTIWMLFWLWK